MSLSEWSEKNCAAVKAAKYDADIEANLLQMLGTVRACWQSADDIMVPLVKVDGSNVSEIVQRTVDARMRAMTTFPPDLLLTGSPAHANVRIEHEGRSIAFEVGRSDAIEYTKSSPAGDSAGTLKPTSTALCELFRWVTTGQGRWVG